VICRIGIGLSADQSIAVVKLTTGLPGLRVSNLQERTRPTVPEDIITHADGSRVSTALISLCDSLCLSVRTIKPKRLKLKPPNSAQG